MENESRQLRALIIVAVVLCAVIIGYNAFFVPEISDYQYFTASQTEALPGDSSDATEKTSSSLLIHINTATEEELDELPGIGPVTAAAIVAYREENGGFRSVEEIMNVDRIGEKTYEKIKPYITL